MPTFTSPENQGGYYTQIGQLMSSVSHPIGTYNLPLTTQIDYQGGTAAVYVGYTTPGSGQALSALSALSVWAIQYIIYDGNGNTLSTQWSTNSASFGDIWNLRVGLTYS
jgi:hypothetical protein